MAEYTQRSQQISPLCQSTQSNIQDKALPVKRRFKILKENSKISKKKWNKLVRC